MMEINPSQRGSSTLMEIELAAALRVPAAVTKKFTSRNKELVMKKSALKMTEALVVF